MKENQAGSPSSTYTAAPTIAEVDQICAIENDIVRNLRITQCYWELSRAFSAQTAAGANWCTFATWASKQAGATIRNEDLSQAIERWLSREPLIQLIVSELSAQVKALGNTGTIETIQKSLLAKLAGEAATRASAAVARGNKKVFEEIGQLFALFSTTCLPDKVYNHQSIDGFCEQLRTGEPPEGQDYLQQAFRHYYQSFFEQDLKMRQELQFLANIEIGYHEQVRLQPEILAALNAAIVEADVIKQFVFNVLLTNLGVVGKIIFFVSALRGKKSLVNQSIERLVTEARGHLRRLITKKLMTLTIPPDLCLLLGKDHEANFPPELQHLSNLELVGFLSRIDLTYDSVEKTGTADWSSLPERLHYIADLFRCYHVSTDLYTAAFTDVQIEAMKAGRLPEGRL